VLGGRVISNYDGQGGWIDTQVYAGTERIGSLGKTEDGSSFFNTFRYADPLTGDEVTTMKSNVFSAFRGQTTLDTNGVGVPLVDPFPPAGEEGDGSCVIWDDNFEGHNKWAATVIPIEGTAKCVLDGLPMECRFISGESSVQCPNNDCGSPSVWEKHDVRSGRFVGYALGSSFQAFADGGTGFMPPGAVYDGEGQWHIPGGDEGGGLRFNHAQQNPAPLTGTQVDKLGSNLQKFLDDPECGKFINAMLGSLPNDVWKTSKYGGSLMDAFNRIKGGGGFLSGDTMSRGALAITNPNTLTTTFDSQRITPLITGQSWQQFGATVILVHEITHVFTNAPNAGVYGHEDMARAALRAANGLGLDIRSTLGLELPTTDKYGKGDAYDKALSEYYGRTLSYACRKVKL
jgi:hypothetical protein